MAQFVISKERPCMNIDLQSRTALVADGDSELGRVICQQLAQSGARVVCLVSSQDKAAINESVFKNNEVEVVSLVANIQDFSTCEGTIQDIEENIGVIDIVINNSDFEISGSFLESSHADWKKSTSINLDSVFNVCRLISEGMGERGFGRIINISSVYGRKGENGKSIYAAAKSGVHGFTMALSQELARKGVTVNTISPGHIKQESTASVDEEKLKQVIGEIPAARLGEADEVASLVGFLCSNQAGFITGNDIAVNGGQYIH